ncbi:MAG: hypothetical protein ACYTEL_12990 [Planctomycetota bacterium]|jgi:hypothetical protein
MSPPSPAGGEEGVIHQLPEADAVKVAPETLAAVFLCPHFSADYCSFLKKSLFFLLNLKKKSDRMEPLRILTYGWTAVLDGCRRHRPGD